MKLLASIVIASVAISIACCREDTKHAAVWPRTFEARLVGQAWEPYRPAPQGSAAADCDDLAIGTREEAAQALVQRPQCADVVIRALEPLAERDARAANDLAAAHMVLAVKDPIEYLRAWEAVQRSLQLTPKLAEARFNQALLEEKLGLAAHWDEVIRRDDPRWAAEGRQHRDRPRRDAMLEWLAVKPKLDDALRRGDRAEVARLIAPFPYAAEHEFEARLARRGNLAEMRLLGEELFRLTGDPFVPDDATRALLARIGAPRTKLTYAAGAADMDRVEREARARGYRRIALKAVVTRAYCRLFQNQFMQSLADYDKALLGYQELGDADGYADTRMRRVSALRELGQSEVAWRENLQVMQSIGQMTLLLSRQALMNDISSSALAANSPLAALRYVDAAIDLHEHSPPSMVRLIAMVGAYAKRAEIEGVLGRFREAQADLAEAKRLAGKLPQDKKRILDARISATQGEILQRGDRPAAIAYFTAALKLVSPESTTIRASLLAQRADAEFAVGKPEEAERDLAQGFALLRKEQGLAVRNRLAEVDDDYWRSYFARFQSPLQSLVGYLLDHGRSGEALRYVEDARAFEPLNLVMPAKNADSITIDAIRAELPANRVILEYSILGDRVAVWIISRRAPVRWLSLKVRRDQVVRWSADLQRAANARRNGDFEAGLDAPYVNLLQKPLEMLDKSVNELVIVPDGPMHALPFAALHNPIARRYLVEDYTVSTSGSARLHLVSMRRDRQLDARRNARLLLVGDPPPNPQLLAQGLGALPHAREEIDEIATIHPGAEVLLGERATIAEFMARAPHSAVIHIASHALVNAAHPSHSVIVLAQSGGDPGLLDAARLLTTKTKLQDTRLVVLSACSSAGGLPIGPEGVAPLVRPLIAAGVPAVIGSLWDVNDATAKELLVSFHRHYDEGIDAAAALRAAQVQMLRNKKNSLAWAAFEVIGYGSSPFAAARR